MNKKNTSGLLVRNLVWATVIFILCTMPSQDIPNPNLDIPNLDKAVHFGLFFIMAILLCNELEYQTKFSLKKIFLTSVFIVFLYGGLIEILQHYCFNRTGDLFDLLADVAGGVVGCLLYPFAKKIKRRILGKK